MFTIHKWQTGLPPSVAAITERNGDVNVTNGISLLQLIIESIMVVNHWVVAVGRLVGNAKLAET